MTIGFMNLLLTYHCLQLFGSKLKIKRDDLGYRISEENGFDMLRRDFTIVQDFQIARPGIQKCKNVLFVLCCKQIIYGKHAAELLTF